MSGEGRYRIETGNKGTGVEGGTEIDKTKGNTIVTRLGILDPIRGVEF